MWQAIRRDDTEKKLQIFTWEIKQYKQKLSENKNDGKC